MSLVREADYAEPEHEVAILKDPNSSDRLYRGILRALYESRFVPGQRLVEPDLMRQFEVGRGTIREVLNRLSASGVVTLVRHHGATVRLLSRRDIQELLDIVEVMLGLACRRAAELISTPGHTQKLTEAYGLLGPHESRDDFPGFLEARENYYRTIVWLSGNREFARLFPAMQVHLMRIQLRHFNRAADALQFSDYAQITALISAGDAKRAEAAGRLHVLHVAESVAGAPDRAFAPDQ